MGNNVAGGLPGSVLQQPHAADVVLGGVRLAGALKGGVPEVQRRRVGQQGHHAGQVLDEEAVHDLLQEALEGGQLGVPQQPVQVLVQDHLLRGAGGRVVEGHLLRVSHQPLR